MFCFTMVLFTQFCVLYYLRNSFPVSPKGAAGVYSTLQKVFEQLHCGEVVVEVHVVVTTCEWLLFTTFAPRSLSTSSSLPVYTEKSHT